jgi:hypothetical protein
LITDVDASELVPDALSAGDERVAVGDVGLDRDRAVPDRAGERLDALGAARQQGEAVAICGQRAGGGFADARGGAGDDRDAAGVGLGGHATTVPANSTM